MYSRKPWHGDDLALRPIQWLDRAKEVDAHPGEWIFITERDTEDAAHSFAHQVTKGKKAAFRPVGKYQARTIGLKVYVRTSKDEA